MMIQNNRHKELVAVYEFIEKATVEEVAGIIAEIRTCHDNILVFNQKHKSLDKVESVAYKWRICPVELRTRRINKKGAPTP